VSIARQSVFCITIALTLLSACPLDSQQPADAAPIPQQILVAKRVFVSNAPGDVDSGFNFYQGPARLYNQFYAAMKAWGQFDLVSSPADADLVFEVSFRFPHEGQDQLRLIIVDPKTRVPLWWFAEKTDETSDKKLDQATTKLVGDVKNLVAPRSIQPVGGKR
jgi:hypothetical protein